MVELSDCLLSWFQPASPVDCHQGRYLGMGPRPEFVPQQKTNRSPFNTFYTTNVVHLAMFHVEQSSVNVLFHVEQRPCFAQKA
jgi:hypothetical protein